MDDMRTIENLELDDMRHTRSVSPVSLANQYRLSQTPKRPEMKRVTRRKKLLNSNKSEKEVIPSSATARHFSEGITHSWLNNMDEEDFDFDGNCYSTVVPILRPPLTLSKSGKGHFWTIPKGSLLEETVCVEDKGRNSLDRTNKILG